MRGIISVIVGSNSCPWCALVCILLFPLLVGAHPKVVLLWVHSSTHTAASVSERFTRKETSGGDNCCFNTGSWSVNPSCCICRHEMEFYGRLWWNGSLGDCTSICNDRAARKHYFVDGLWWRSAIHLPGSLQLCFLHIPLQLDPPCIIEGCKFLPYTNSGYRQQVSLSRGCCSTASQATGGAR